MGVSENRGFTCQLVIFYDEYHDNSLNLLKSDLITPFDDISGVNFLDKVRLLEFLMCLYRDMAVHWSLNLDLLGYTKLMSLCS